METKIITELVKFNALNTITDEQLIRSVYNLSVFQKKNDGFLDAETAKDLKEES